MAFEGMDVDQAQSLARQLDHHAQALAQISAAAADLAAQISLYWRGPAAATFHQEWEGRHRPALTATAHALSDMHARLTANIREQQQASAAGTADGHSGAGGATAVSGAAAVSLAGIARGAASLASNAWKWTNDISDGVSLVTTPAEKIMEIAGNKDVTGRYDTAWTTLKNAVGDPAFLHYKQSPVLHALHDSPRVQAASKILNAAHAPAVLDVADKATGAIGWANVGVDGVQAANDAAHGHYAAAGGEVVDGTATALKSSHNPVAYLAGGDLALLKADYDLAGQVDWKEGIPNPFTGTNFRDDYLPTFKSLPGQALGIVAKAFS